MNGIWTCSTPRRRGAPGRLAASDASRAEAELSTAIGLWRGDPLSDLPLRPALARQVAQFQERRLLAEEDYTEALLALGAPADVVRRLRVRHGRSRQDRPGAALGAPVAGRFPDGQLYANLRGYDEAGVASPLDAPSGFLEALGVPHTRNRRTWRPGRDPGPRRPAAASNAES